jgi:hypothetical protein
VNADADGTGATLPGQHLMQIAALFCRAHTRALRFAATTARRRRGVSIVKTQQQRNANSKQIKRVAMCQISSLNTIILRNAMLTTSGKGRLIVCFFDWFNRVEIYGG